SPHANRHMTSSGDERVSDEAGRPGRRSIHGNMWTSARAIDVLGDVMLPADLDDRSVAMQPGQNDFQPLRDFHLGCFCLSLDGVSSSVERPSWEGAPDTILASGYAPRLSCCGGRYSYAERVNA
ncbi:MAG: hypothetical protein ACXVHL_31850, partial [Solirubrobacteraceae bacterium]